MCSKSVQNFPCCTQFAKSAHSANKRQMAGSMNDYPADVQKYDSSADVAVANKIVRRLGIALRNRDSALVSASDPLERVKERWCEKKLGVGGSEADAAIAAAAKAMPRTVPSPASPSTTSSRRNSANCRRSDRRGRGWRIRHHPLTSVDAFGSPPSISILPQASSSSALVQTLRAWPAIVLHSRNIRCRARLRHQAGDARWRGKIGRKGRAPR